MGHAVALEIRLLRSIGADVAASPLLCLLINLYSSLTESKYEIWPDRRKLLSTLKTVCARLSKFDEASLLLRMRSV